MEDLMPAIDAHRDVWRMVRSKVQHEESWIQQRVSWHLATNAFLFSAYSFVVVSTGSNPGHVSPPISVLVVLIPLVGALFSSFVYIGALASGREVNHTVHEWSLLGPGGAASKKLPAIHMSAPALKLAKFATTGISITAIVMWLILLGLWLVTLLGHLP
jgi:hypothetical protein